MIPAWAILGLSASLVSTAIPLIQERFRANGFALAIVAKLVTFLCVLPFVIGLSLPVEIDFYIYTALLSVLWCISDVIYFRSVPLAGAGVVSRLLPSAVLISFLLWFVFDPGLFWAYLERPWQSALIATIIVLASYFATKIRQCEFSWAGFRMIWFVIFAACVGPIISKITLGQAAAHQAPFALAAIQSLFMLMFWIIYYAVRKPIPLNVFYNATTIKAGISIGAVMALTIVLKLHALQTAEHPAYVSVLLFTDALWILLYHKATNKEDRSNIWAGMGIVFCAALLVAAKSF